MSIWDIRFGPPKKTTTFADALKAAGIALDEWITIKGTHVELGENGEILNGMQGKFKKLSDVPRKTVKQREGESTERFHERAAQVFRQQDKDKEFKQRRAELRDQALKHDWKSDPPAGVETWFARRAKQEGKIGEHAYQYVKLMPPTKIIGESEKALRCHWYDSDEHVNVKLWVPKAACITHAERKKMDPDWEWG